MTEDEAKTKWCPFVRLAYTTAEFETNPPAVSISRLHDNSSMAEAKRAAFNCIGSACMAWREQRDDVVRGVVIGGFCGLAGRP